MAELFSIKQEPELDIVSDDDVDPTFGPSTDGEVKDSVQNNRKLMVRSRN